MPTGKHTGDQALVRELNLSIVLNVLREHSPLSRASLAAITGLNRATVSSLINELTRAGLVWEVGIEATDDVGRPGRLLELDPHAGRIIGMEVGVDFIALAIADFSSQIIWKRWVELTDGKSPEEVLGLAADLIQEGVELTDKEYGQVLGLGVGVPGLVDVPRGHLLFAPNLGWRDVPVRSMFEERFPFTVYVENEANMAALGESYFGVARGYNCVLYISAGVGVGGGIVLGGQIMRGAMGFSGEVGHMTMVEDGPICGCGNRGCWETLVSESALVRRMLEALRRAGETPSWARDDHLTVPTVLEAARAGDRLAQGVLNEVARDVGLGIANLVNVLNPEIVVLGGMLSMGGDLMLPTIRETLEHRGLRWLVQPLRLELAALGRESCVLGGIATVYDRVLSQPVEAIPKVAQGRRRTPIP